MIYLDSTGNLTPLVLDVSDWEDITDIDDNGLDGERDNENAICGERTILYSYVATHVEHR